MKRFCVFILFCLSIMSCTPIRYMSPSYTDRLRCNPQYYTMDNVWKYMVTDTLVMYELYNITQQEILLSSFLEYMNMPVEKRKNVYGEIKVFCKNKHTHGEILNDYTYDMLNFFLRDGYNLPLTITPINLKYTIPFIDRKDKIWSKYYNNCHFEYYKVTIPYILDSVCVEGNVCRVYRMIYSKYRQPSSMFNVWDSTLVQGYKRQFVNRYSPKGYSKVEIPFFYSDAWTRMYKDIKQDEYLIAIRRRANCISCETSENPFEIYFLSKAFAHYEVSQKKVYDRFLLDYLFSDTTQNTYKIPQPIDTSNLPLGLGFKTPIKIAPSFLTPYIYIMNWSEYEPEEVVFKKKIGNRFYYTFYSNRLQKNVEVVFNNKKIEFVKYIIKE